MLCPKNYCDYWEWTQDGERCRLDHCYRNPDCVLCNHDERMDYFRITYCQLEKENVVLKSRIDKLKNAIKQSTDEKIKSILIET